MYLSGSFIILREEFGRSSLVTKMMSNKAEKHHYSPIIL